MSLAILLVHVNLQIITRGSESLRCIGTRWAISMSCVARFFASVYFRSLAASSFLFIVFYRPGGSSSELVRLKYTFFLLRTSKILPSLNVVILEAYFSLKCSYFVLICSSCHKCFTRVDLMKSKIFVVYVNIVHIVSKTTE